MSTFQVIERVPVVRYEDRVLLETDDWAEAEAFLVKDGRKRRPSQPVPRIFGTHPTHDWSGEPDDVGRNRCATCGSPRNGCFKSHMPCGYQDGGKPFVTLLEDLGYLP